MYFIRGYWIIVYYPLRVVSRWKSDVPTTAVHSYRIFSVFKYDIFFHIINFTSTGRVDRLVSCTISLCWYDRLWSSSDLVKSWGGGGECFRSYECTLERCRSPYSRCRSAAWAVSLLCLCARATWYGMTCWPHHRMAGSRLYKALHPCAGKQCGRTKKHGGFPHVMQAGRLCDSGWIIKWSYKLWFLDLLVRFPSQLCGSSAVSANKREVLKTPYIQIWCRCGYMSAPHW